MNAIEKLFKAKEQFSAARDRLEAATAAAIPVGKTVQVKLGNATVIGPVIASGSWGHYPDTVRVMNRRTGKERKFTATYDQWQILGE